jgi:hypothetical protein
MEVLMQRERRANRRDNILEALGHLLDATARRAHFSSITLTEGQGITVAAVGDTAEAEDIAVISPRLAPGARLWQGIVETADGNKRITVAPVSTDEGPLFLCAVGGMRQAIAAELLRGGVGVCRILA